jgi:hypothetical protein
MTKHEIEDSLSGRSVKTLLRSAVSTRHCAAASCGS